jgi:large subunit ribosomal protein L17
VKSRNFIPELFKRTVLLCVIENEVEHERIETTEAKAKELRGITDRLITLGKEDTLHSRRGALRVLRTKQAVSKLFDDVAKRFPDRHGGYTRIIKTRQRPGDGAPLVAIELVETAIESQVTDTTKISEEQDVISGLSSLVDLPCLNR